MGEPASTTASVVVAGAAGAGFAGLIAGVDSYAAVGALAGAIVFFMTTEELPVWKRLVFFLVSVVMGSLRDYERVKRGYFRLVDEDEL